MMKVKGGKVLHESVYVQEYTERKREWAGVGMGMKGWYLCFGKK